MKTWMENCYARLLIDNHISECDPSFMTKFSPSQYVEMVREADVDSAMVYACCHNGNCYYPTKNGHMHKNLNGRDIFGETVEGLNKAGIIPIAYTTVIYHNDSAKNNLSWRMKDICGNEHSNRYWFSCPNNSAYLNFTLDHLSEIISYDIKGVFIDMTFWPMVCLCDSCRKRYRDEAGSEIPEIIDWENPSWVSFQRARERWMVEFANKLSAHIKSQKPELSVVHQFSPVLHGWFLGQSSGIAEASDYASGDFYGGLEQQRFGTKVFAAYSRNIPFEFMTSRCVKLYDHTTSKSDDELFVHAATTLANGGAYFFIDAINPDGTLCHDTYKMLARVAGRLKPFKKCMQKHNPKLLADTGLYFSMASCVNDNINKSDIRKLNESSSNMEGLRETPVLHEMIGASELLNQCHIPYKIITDNTKSLDEFRTIIINNATYLSDEEIERLRAFVFNGGTLITTGKTSLFDTSGNSNGDLRLKDVFGVTFSGTATGRTSYLTIDFDKYDFISGDRPSPLCKALSARQIYSVTVPHFKCDDPENYASIHSNPPGVNTEYCALSENDYGNGKCIYLYSPLTASRDHAQQSFVKKLFHKYVRSDLKIVSNAPSCIEFSILKSKIENTVILGVVNFQKQLPNLPVYNLDIKLALSGVREIRSVSEPCDIPFSSDGKSISFKINKIDNAEMFEIKRGK